ncbi:hypothetical protein ACMFMG_004510 [Clarireedia jacksonii]
MPDNAIVRRRAACDRCHSQKLRCHRQPSTDICERCAKAHTECLYSPFRQKPATLVKSVKTTSSTERTYSDEAGTPSVLPNIPNELKRKRSSEHENGVPRHPSLYESERQRATVIDNNWIGDMNYQEVGWEGLDLVYFDNILLADNLVGPSAVLEGQEPESQGNCQAETTQHHTTNSEYRGADQISEFVMQTPSRGSVVEKAVSEIDLTNSPISKTINLHHTVWPSDENAIPRRSQSPIASSCIQTLSKLAVDLHGHRMTVPPQSIHKRGSPLNISAPYSDFSIDKTFRLTQSLVDIYPSCIETFVTRTAILSSANFREMNFDNSREPLTSTVASGVVEIDQPSILLILSCHMRLIDIYEELYKHAQACMAGEGTACSYQQTNLSIPALRIGSYVPPPSMAVSIQMMLLMHLLTQLLDYATQLLTLIQPSRHAGETVGMKTSGTEISLGTAENVRNGARNMVAQFSRLQGTMREQGIIA